MSEDIKNKLWKKAQENLKNQVTDLQEQLDELQKAAEIEEKSSAGDKFETHQEVLNQNRTLLEKRLSSTKVMLNQLRAVPVKVLDKVQEGALLDVPMGKIWVSVPMGKVELDGTDYQLVSSESPLIQALWELKKGESAKFRDKDVVVEDIS